MNIDITWLYRGHANAAWRVLVWLILLCSPLLALRAAEDVREHGRVTITSAGLHGPSGTHSTMKVNAYFRSGDSEPMVDAGSVLVAGVNLEPHVEGANTQYMAHERSVTATNGRTVHVTIGGSTANNVPSFIDSVYCPTAFQIAAQQLSPRSHACEFDRAKGLTLAWNADPLADSLTIMIVPALGGNSDVDTPADTPMIMQRMDDRGQITIPPESFDVFPMATRSFTVILIRESRRVVEHGGRAFTLIGRARVFLNVDQTEE